MIPKIIHYCWFGDNEKPELVKKCIDSWKTFLPDYEIREWNNRDLENCNIKYVQDAIKEKKWAFVSDYFRLYALYNYGGIYLDSDNEVFKSLDDFLNLDFFTGYEEIKNKVHAFTALVASQKENTIVKDLLDEYNTLSFYDEDGNLNLCTNTQRVENYFIRKFGLKKPFDAKNPFYLNETSVIFPSNYFCSYDEDISYAVHHFNGSWLPDVLGYSKKYISKNIYFKIYTVTKGRFVTVFKTVKELILFFYPRINKRTVVVTIGISK